MFFSLDFFVLIFTFIIASDFVGWHYLNCLYLNTLRDDAALLEGENLKKAHFYVEAYSPFTP